MELPRTQTDIGDTGGDEDQNLPLVGRSPAMQEIYRTVARLTQNDLSVLVTGDSGTGKELIARACMIMAAAARAVRGAEYGGDTRELMRVSFSGTKRGFYRCQPRMAGRFAQAEGGTLFLDEIGDMPMETQTRLLRVCRKVSLPLSAGDSPSKQMWIIAATHQDLQQLIQQGLFREDLYFRLNVVPLRVPPLRERLEDIDDLVRHFVALGQREGLAPKSFDADALSSCANMIGRECSRA